MSSSLARPGLPLSQRLLPIVSLLCPTVVSSVLVWSWLSHQVFTGTLYTFVLENTVSSLIAVNVLAHVLAFLQIFALSTIINYSSRSLLLRRTTSLHTLKLWNSITNTKVDLTLSPGGLLIAILYVACVLLPAVGWLAAITPSFVTTTIPQSTTVPAYPADRDGLYWNRSWNAWDKSQLYSINTETFTFTPGVYQAASIMNSMSTASTADSSPRVHTKSETLAFNYIGRSYGVGASVGLDNLTSPVQAPLLGYGYSEPGYVTTVQCAYNQTSRFEIEPAETPHNYGGSMPNLYWARGPFPPSNEINIEYAVAGFGNNSIVAIGAYGDISGTIAIVAGDSYDLLNKIQCSVVFDPAIFDVVVGVAGKNITVTPRPAPASGTPPVPDIDPSEGERPGHKGMLQQAALWELVRISQRNLDLYSSTLGESLHANILRRARAANWTENVSSTQLLAAASDSFEAALDDILLSIASAQYMVGPDGSRVRVDIDMEVSACIIGTARGIWGVFAFAVLLAVSIVQALWTRLWRDTPAWDYNDITDLVVGVSRGNTDIADAYGQARYSKDVMVKLAAVDRTYALLYGGSNQAVVEKTSVTAAKEDPPRTAETTAVAQPLILVTVQTEKA